MNSLRQNKLSDLLLYKFFNVYNRTKYKYIYMNSVQQ